MKLIYQLYHIHSKTDKDTLFEWNEFKELGYFSSKSNAAKAIEEFYVQEGFCEYSRKCFKLHKWVLWGKSKHIDKFYELYHSYYDKEDCNNFTYFGIFKTEEKAQQKKNKLIKKNKFYAKHANGFDISEEFIDDPNTVWMEGFKM